MMKMVCVMAVLATLLALQVKAEEPQCDHRVFDQQATAVVEIRIPYNGRIQGGTAVFVAPLTLATVEHVLIDAMDESGGGITVSFANQVTAATAHSYTLSVTSVDFVETALSDRVALLHLDAGILDRSVAGVQYAPLTNGQPVVSIFYQDGALQHFYGWYRMQKASSDPETKSGKTEPFLPFQLVPKYSWGAQEPRPGSSGGPVFDCDGRVVSLISKYVDVPKINLSSFFDNMAFVSNENRRRIKSFKMLPNAKGVPVTGVTPED